MQRNKQLKIQLQEIIGLERNASTASSLVEKKIIQDLVAQKQRYSVPLSTSLSFTIVCISLQLTYNHSLGKLSLSLLGSPG